MKYGKDAFRGVIPAAFLPMVGDGDIDWGTLGTYVDYLVDGRPCAVAFNMEAGTERCSTTGHPGHEGLLTSGIWHLAAGFAVDEALIYGDYYYMRALTHLHEPRTTSTQTVHR